jgi:hypothetical protein
MRNILIFITNVLAYRCRIKEKPYSFFKDWVRDLVDSTHGVLLIELILRNSACSRIMSHLRNGGGKWFCDSSTIFVRISFLYIFIGLWSYLLTQFYCRDVNLFKFNNKTWKIEVMRIEIIEWLKTNFNTFFVGRKKCWAYLKNHCSKWFVWMP